MIYRITVINGRKYATAVKSREEFLFFHDIDCYDMSDGGSKMADVILSKKDEIGLMMLERSASGGWHLVCKRVPGTTILENQVRIACVLKVADMDNNARDLQRVVFGTSGAAEDLIYLDNELFEEPMSAEECEAEYVRLKERERNGEEQLPPSAKKANKHYKPWEEDTPSLSSRPSASSPLSSRPSEARGEISQMRLKAQAASRKDSSTTLGMTSGGDFPDTYHGIPFTTILKKYWELNNGGFEPNVGDRDTLTYQLASDLRHICGRSAEWLDQVIPCYDGFPIEEKRQKIANALKSSYEGMPGRLKDVLDALEGRKAKAQEVQPEQSALPEQMPEMPSEKKLPKLIRLLTRNTPKQYKATSLYAILWPT